MVISSDKACIISTEQDNTVILCEEEHENYFYNFFDLSRDYSKIYKSAQKSGVQVLKTASKLAKGVRILNQNSEEMTISFMISQNNNIPRIKRIINALCVSLGEKKQFMGYDYYSFPTLSAFLAKDEQFYKDTGMGYRANYMASVCEFLQNNDLSKLGELSDEKLKAILLKVKGIGEKVANCVCLFGFHKTHSFPVDTWIEKIYIENFNGKLNNRDKITQYFKKLFGENSGYFQQYLFYYKRSLEKLQ